jgi:hypothetical protein
MMPRLAIRAGALALLALGQPAGQAWAGVSISVSEFKRIMPPAGLYRVDSDGLVNQAAGSFRQTEDGASGDVTTRISSGGASHQQHFKGSGAITRCVPLLPAGAVTLPPVMAGGVCKTLSTRVDGDSIVHEAQCATGPVTNTIRKLGGDEWEIINHVRMSPVAGAPDLNHLRPLLQQMAQHGTPEERARASETLAKLPQMQRQMNAERAQVSAEMAKAQASARTPEEAAAIAQAMQAMQQTGSNMDATGRQRWTRISNSCAGAGQ